MQGQARLINNLLINEQLKPQHTEHNRSDIFGVSHRLIQHLTQNTHFYHPLNWQLINFVTSNYIAKLCVLISKYEMQIHAYIWIHKINCGSYTIIKINCSYPIKPRKTDNLEFLHFSPNRFLTLASIGVN